MKKKVLAAILIAVGVLTGCGNSEPISSPIPTVEAEPIATDTKEVEQPAATESSADEVAPEHSYRSELTNEWIDEDLKDQRPIAVMVDNERTALPHFGTADADVVYEIMNSTLNDRITRFMVVVKDWEKIEQLGSIRSARPTNFMLAAEWNAVLCHDGGPYFINDWVAKDYSANFSGGFARFNNGKATEFTEYITYDTYTNSQKGKTYEKNRYIKCFDFTKPTLNAAVSDGLLSIQAHDTDSGIKAIYVNGYEFTEHTNGALNIRLQQFDAGYQYFTISAMDNAGNTSEIYKTANPYYTDPENKDSNEKDPAQQLPVDASATKPSSATAQVTEHTKTDVNGNTVSKTGSGTNSSSSATAKQSPSTGDTSKDADQSSDSQTTEKGKEFYTIQTASEKVFYLVIDRDGEDEKVYFLTEVSENDLLNTTTDNSETLPKNSAALESAIPTKDSALSNNNADTTGEKTQGAESVEDSTEDSTEDTSEPKEDTAKADGSGFTYILMGIAAVAVIGVVYVVKSKKKKENFIDEDEDEDELDEDYDYEDEEETEQDSDEAFINGGDDTESVDTDENDNEDNNNENDEEDGEE